MAGLSQEERDVIAAKLKCQSFESAFPRAMSSVMEDVFYLVDTARWHLKRDGSSQRWRENVAFSMWEFARSLQEAAEAATEIERKSGFSGRALSEE